MFFLHKLIFNHRYLLFLARWIILSSMVLFPVYEIGYLAITGPELQQIILREVRLIILTMVLPRKII
ncbi:hypothetical protein ACJX0J_039647, partial [Zea mays]